MKKVFFAALAAVFVLASCTKEENGIDTQGKEAVLYIAVKGNAPDTRTVDGGTIGIAGTDVADDPAIMLNDAKLFLFNVSGALVQTEDVTTFTGEAFTTTTAATKAYVIGNIGSTVALTGIDTEDKLKALLADFTALDPSHKWLSAPVQAISWSRANPALATVSFELRPVLSRLDVKFDVSGFTNFGTATSKTHFDGVAVLYSAAKTHLAGTLASAAAEITTPNKYYYSGISGWTNEIANDNAVPTPNIALLKQAITTDNISGFPKSFYALPLGTGAPKSTILTVYGWYDTNGDGTKDNGEERYWPVHFGTGTHPALANGSLYQVTLKFTGKAGDINDGSDENGGDEGTTDPEAEIKTATLTVIVSSKGWLVATPITVEF